METEGFKKLLEAEGFAHVYEWTDVLHAEYPTHEHKDRVSFFVSDGAVDVFVDGKNIHLVPGDRFDVSAGERHSAHVGPDGCTFVVGEMIKGDS